MTDRAAADEQAIRSLVHRYADAASRRDARSVASTFTSDGEWYSPALGRHRGTDAMIAFFTSMLDGWSVFLQGMQSGVVVLDETDGDRAAGRWFVQETGQRETGSAVSIAGVYHDEYSRVDDRWHIAHRRYDPLLRTVDGVASALPFPSDVPSF
jgi:uncharacterized protein (TIGR02246 family)